jgi:2-hydroxychromene-2-carboxylate isomerase
MKNVSFTLANAGSTVRTALENHSVAARAPLSDDHLPQVTFYFDLGSPYAYLAAERIQGVHAEPQGIVLAEHVRWQPLSLGGLFKSNGRSSWALGDYRRRQDGMAEVERRARQYALPPIHWPDPWPGNYLMAMRAATYAFTVGRGRELTLEAFRDAFQRGRDLSIPAHVLDAGERAGLNRTELEAATQEPATKQALRDATNAAHAAGVIGVPTLAIGRKLFWGDDRLEDAAASLVR